MCTHVGKFLTDSLWLRSRNLVSRDCLYTRQHFLPPKPDFTVLIVWDLCTYSFRFAVGEPEGSSLSAELKAQEKPSRLPVSSYCHQSGVTNWVLKRDLVAKLWFPNSKCTFDFGLLHTNNLICYSAWIYHWYPMKWLWTLSLPFLRAFAAHYLSFTLMFVGCTGASKDLWHDEEHIGCTGSTSKPCILQPYSWNSQIRNEPFISLGEICHSVSENQFPCLIRSIGKSFACWFIVYLAPILKNSKTWIRFSADQVTRVVNIQNSDFWGLTRTLKPSNILRTDSKAFRRKLFLWQQSAPFESVWLWSSTSNSSICLNESWSISIPVV